jgi:hypothetical protein
VDLTALANLGEFISGVAVVVSLIYLALQVRQNTDSLRTENHARALDRLATQQSRMSTDRDLADVFGRGTLDPRSLTREERIQFSWAFYEMFGSFEFMFQQAERGALPEAVWKRWAATVSWWTSLPGVQVWWRAKPAPFSASFSAFVEECIRAGPADPDAARRWTEFLSRGSPPSAEDVPVA